MSEITPERRTLARWKKAWEVLQDVMSAMMQP
jgi:hypothetical protein